VKNVNTFPRGLLLVLFFSIWLVAHGNRSERPLAAYQGENLLQNPGFEGNFFAWSGINEIQVAHGWTPFWWEQPDRDPPFFRPEYKRAVAAQFPNRVLSGESAQQWFTFHASHWAGMYQQVFNVTPGQRYRFSIWAQVWSSTESVPATVSINPSNPRLRVGIDPTGNWQAGAGTIVWSAEASMGGHIDRWGEISVEAVAQNNTITVFMRTNPDFATKHNDMYWDNASLVAIEPVPPTPLPATDTPAAAATTPATATEAATPLPTATPVATATVPATATATAVPTDTPLPSATAVTATDTPAPAATATVAATETPAAATAVASPTLVATEVAALPVTAAVTATPPETASPALIGSTALLITAATLLVLSLLVIALFWWRRSSSSAP
jgi:hypothetical protein